MSKTKVIYISAFAMALALVFAPTVIALTSTSSTIYACLTAYGTLTKVSKKKSSCPKGTSLITWNQTGATGPKGIAGVRGAKGETGAKGDTGARGEAGSRGLAGPKGDDGTDGKNGLDGRDASPLTSGLWAQSNDGRFFRIASLTENEIAYIFEGQILYFPIRWPGETNDSILRRYVERMGGFTNPVAYTTSDCSGKAYTLNVFDQKLYPKFGITKLQIVDNPNLIQPGVQSERVPEFGWFNESYASSTATLTELDASNIRSFMTYGSGVRSVNAKFGLSANNFQDSFNNSMLTNSPSYSYSNESINTCTEVDWDAEISFYVKAMKSLYRGTSQADKDWATLKRDQLSGLNLWELSDGVNPGITSLKLVMD